MKNLTIPTLMAVMAATSANAAFLESGVEYEAFAKDFATKNDNALPYLAVGFNPVADLPLTFAFKHSDKQMKDRSVPADRARQEYMVSYKHSVNEDFVIAPMFAIRHNHYEGSTHDTEWRFHPNMSCKLDDTFTLALDGFVAPVKRVSHTDKRNYSDFKHELDFRANITLNDTQSARISFYNEANKKEGQEGKGDAKANEWQLRLMFTQQLNDFSLTPYARIDLDRKFEVEPADAEKRLRHRVGLLGSYKLQQNLDLVYDVNYQVEQSKASESKYDKNRMFYKLAIKYSF